MTLKNCIFAAATVLTSTIATAQTDDTPARPHLTVALETRADFTIDNTPHQGTESGIHGRYLNLKIDGNINSQFSYHWRQRINRMGNYGSDVFGSTDWLYLDYRATRNFSFAAGKQVVMIGGYEYDAAPIDVYFASRFWNNIACFQFGASASYIADDGYNTFSFQVCNSPYQEIGRSCYAYNLFWNGGFGCWHTLWSVNAMEYLKDHFANFIALGNLFDLGRLELQLDLMNRYTPHSKFWLEDYTLIGQAKYNVLPSLTLMVKGGKDRFHPMLGAPQHMDKWFGGAGIELFPLKGSRNVRIHALWNRTHDNDGVACNEFSLGLKWRVELFKR